VIKKLMFRNETWSNPSMFLSQSRPETSTEPDLRLLRRYDFAAQLVAEVVAMPVAEVTLDFVL
jgi:hypothetical protein